MDIEPFLRIAGIGASYFCAAMYLGSKNSSLIRYRKDPQRRHQRPFLVIFEVLFIGLSVVVLASLVISLKGLGANPATQLAVASAFVVGIALSAVVSFAYERFVGSIKDPTGDS